MCPTHEHKDPSLLEHMSIDVPTKSEESKKEKPELWATCYADEPKAQSERLAVTDLSKR